MRSFALSMAGAAALALFSAAAPAQDKFTYMTNWYAQAEHGGLGARPSGRHQHDLRRRGLDRHVTLRAKGRRLGLRLAGFHFSQLGTPVGALEYE